MVEVEEIGYFGSDETEEEKKLKKAWKKAKPILKGVVGMFTGSACPTTVGIAAISCRSASKSSTFEQGCAYLKKVALEQNSKCAYDALKSAAKKDSIAKRYFDALAQGTTAPASTPSVSRSQAHPASTPVTRAEALRWVQTVTAQARQQITELKKFDTQRMAAIMYLYIKESPSLMIRSARIQQVQSAAPSIYAIVSRMLSDPTFAGTYVLLVANTYFKK